MFGLFRAKNPYEQPAKDLYAAALGRVRDPLFYREYGVPDTIDGRFDLLLMHIFIMIDRAKDEGSAGALLSQALFDETFANMDQILREMGIGDMGLPKHMRRMMKAFNGRMHAYRKAVQTDDNDGQALQKALARNLYGTIEIPEEEMLTRMADYMREAMTILKRREFSDVAQGRIDFLPLQESLRYGT